MDNSQLNSSTTTSDLQENFETSSENLSSTNNNRRSIAVTAEESGNLVDSNIISNSYSTGFSSNSRRGSADSEETGEFYSEYRDPDEQENASIDSREIENNRIVFDDEEDFENVNIVIPSSYAPIRSTGQQSSNSYDRGIEYNRYEMTRADVRRQASASGSNDWLGIPWQLLRHTRSEYRLNRLKSYYNYTNIEHDLNTIRNEILRQESNSAKFYDFYYSKLKEIIQIPHFQLRNLLRASCRGEVYYGCGTQIKRWDSLNKTCKSVVDVRGTGQASSFRITCIALKDDILLAGGYLGELACHSIKSNVTTLGTASRNDNGITNYIEVASTRGGCKLALCSNNDSKVRMISLSTMKPTAQFDFSVPINCTRQSPDHQLLCVVGDSTVSFLVDSKSGEILHELAGHLDHTFACAWSESGVLIATGNQDKTARIYDIRNTKKSLHVLEGKMAAIRSIEFKGEFMAMAEAADFVHIYDVVNDFKRSQVLDIFGEIGGMSFSEDVESLFFGSSDDVYGGLIELERVKYAIEDYL